MKSYYAIAMWLVVALSPLGMFFINFEFGAARNLSLLNLLPLYLLLAVAMGITAFFAGVRSFSRGHCSKRDRVVGGAALAFLILFVLSLAFQRKAFEHGAKARIDSLGGAAFVAKLQNTTEMLIKDGDPSWGYIPQEKVPEDFGQIGCQSAFIRRNEGILQMSVTGAFMGSGWWLVLDDEEHKFLPGFYKVYPHLYRYIR